MMESNKDRVRQCIEKLKSKEWGIDESIDYISKELWCTIDFEMDTDHEYCCNICEGFYPEERGSDTFSFFEYGKTLTQSFIKCLEKIAL